MLQRLTLAAVVVSALAIGCDSKKEEAPPTPQTTADQMKKDAAKAVDSAKTEVNKAADEAEKKLQQALDYINEKKLDLADQGLKQLEAMKDSLPPAVQKKVTDARAKLDAAKADAK